MAEEVAPLSRGYVYNRTWRYKNPDKRTAAKVRNYAVTRDTATNARQPWTQAHDALVLESDLTDRELGLLIGRSVQAIQVRRGRLKKETDD